MSALFADKMFDDTLNNETAVCVMNPLRTSRLKILTAFGTFQNGARLYYHSNSLV